MRNAEIPLTEIYDLTFYDQQFRQSYRAAQLILPHVLAAVGRPSSVLDIGCGVGTWLRAVRDYVPDVHVVGVDHPSIPLDVLMISPEEYVGTDLSQGVDMQRKFDLALSLEVGEHLDASSGKALVASLARHSDTILFSAAIPGQGGTHHINENWPEYWIDEFCKQDYVCNDIIRPLIWKNEEIPFWYRQNILLFTKFKLCSDGDFISFGGQNLVHPAMYEKIFNMYEKVVNRQITERDALSVLKASLRRRLKSIKRRIK
jgi:SAM-dependent methyltransferase